ncbi:hypothetical protein HDA32_001502 [Spinactinospora alkalitolerans]|uniref:Uncharacterized protein n=1 Tax=Spinactinospora alkalitolerans TaxID=687207 RepID=A0A852TU42_9ACTN|nr:hypothetical protein [Spinactinospora alkalitolerans]NYE46382.1 hypothetical protein [Spinactinospora alkalitolerans]
MKLRSIAATTTTTALLTLCGGAFLAAPAAADLVTSCNGQGGAVTVPGDLVVPAGKSCTLTGTTVEGDVTVRAGADLVVKGGTFKGKVIVREDGYLDTTDTEISGAVTARSAFGAYLEDSELSANLRAVAVDGSTVQGFVFSIGSSVDGNVNARTGDLFAESSTIGGDFTGDGTGYTDLYDSVVDGDLRVAGNAHGSIFCGGEVYGDATYTGNSDTVQIGSDGPVAGCSATSYWHNNVTVKGNTATVHIDDNIIRGDLTARDNDPVALAGQDNRVRGTINGELGEIGSAQARTLSVQERSEGLEAKADDRREAAEAEAEKAGQAF